VGIGALGGLEGFLAGGEAAAGAARLLSRQTTLDIEDRWAVELHSMADYSIVSRSLRSKLHS
jgi:hypothetical protein